MAMATRVETPSAATSTTVFMETAKTSPSMRPKASARLKVNGPETATTRLRSQSAAQRSSVRNSVEVSKNQGESAAQSISQGAALREKRIVARRKTAQSETR